jgi:hypothetical protein
MLDYVLKWFDLGRVKDIYPIVRARESVCAKHSTLGPALTPAGIYMFLDDCKRTIDVGKANPNHRMKLRWRLRNEVFGNSASADKFRKNLGMDENALFELSLKVAHVEHGIDFSKTFKEIDSHLLLIERALICETDPLSDSHGGVEKWEKEELEIVN